jgi:ABC-type multidrug transport system ATPase subunit
MGPSGAGKTTLLNILAARAGGFLIGNVKLNDRILEQKDMRMMMNYIPQDDVLFSALTPRETLTYTAKLRIANQTEQQRNALVSDLMDKLGITRCADVIVGNELTKGISGGQKKRTSVAMELVTNPSILFVDEATSGLDSQTAEDVVRILRDISRTGRTVICTIHQPSFDIFRMFDKLLLLQAGQVVYNGSVAESTKYFGSLGWACPEVLNPAEYFMRILTLEKPLGYENDKQLSYVGDSMMVGRRVIHRKPIGPWANAWKSHSIREEDKIRNSKDFSSSSRSDTPNLPKKFDDDRV